MRERKICLWLGRLDEAEQELYLSFLASPLHSNRPKLAEMMELLLRKVVRVPGCAWSAEKFWSEFYTDRDYNANLLSRLLSEATHEFKSFISLRQFQNDPGSPHIQRLRWLRNQGGWADVIPSALKETEAKLDRDLPRDEHYYYCKFQLAVERSMYDVDHLGKNPGPIFQDCHDQIDRLFTFSKIRYLIQAENHDRMHTTNHQVRYSDQAMRYPQIADETTSPFLFLYFIWYSYQKGKNSAPEFEEYKGKLIRMAAEIQKSPSVKSQIALLLEMKFFFVTAINHCSKKINAGEVEWTTFYHQLNEVGMKTGITLERGKIPVREFINQAGTYSRFLGFGPADKFIKAYSPILESDPDLIVSRFAYASNHFYALQYKKSKELLVRIKNDFNPKVDVSVMILARMMLCRVWFELNDWEPFVYEVHAFRNYLRREKRFSQRRLESYQQFCKVCLKLERVARGLPEVRAAKLDQLRVSTSNTPKIALRGWLLKAIDRIIENRGASFH